MNTTPLEELLRSNQRVSLTVWSEDHEGEQGETFATNILTVHRINRLVLIATPLAVQAISRKIVPEMVVGATVYTEQFPLIIYPTALEPQTEPAPGYWFTLPGPMDYTQIQRRQSFRATVMLLVEVQREDGTRFSGRTHNMSAGGLRFSTAQQFASGEMLTLRMKLTDGLFEGQVTVLQSFENPNHYLNREDQYVTTCRFLELPKTQERLVVGECFKQEAARLAREKGVDKI